MKININGKQETIQPCTISELVMSRGLRADALVVEHNQQIIKQDAWGKVSLKENDALELLSFVGGG